MMADPTGGVVDFIANFPALLAALTFFALFLVLLFGAGAAAGYIFLQLWKWRHREEQALGFVVL
jgi:hypothetical protein